MKPEEKKLLLEEAKHFVTIKGERLLIAHRRHPFTLLPQFFILSLFSLAYLFVLGFSIFYLPQFFVLAVLGLFLGASIVGLFAAKIVIAWQFHLYIVTTKKVLEASYVPLSDYFINDILLEQVKCTEVDIHTHGLVHELFDMGDIELTFDRPTHHATFILHHIPYVRETAVFLTSELLGKSNGIVAASQKKTTQRWFKTDGKNDGYRYTEDIFP